MWQMMMKMIEPDDDVKDTIKHRRSTMMRVGYLVILLAVSILTIVGCIFDEGPYHDGKGGGRRTEAPTSQPTQPVTPGTGTTNPPSSSGTQQDTGAGNADP